MDSVVLVLHWTSQTNETFVSTPCTQTACHHHQLFAYNRLDDCQSNEVSLIEHSCRHSTNTVLLYTQRYAGKTLHKYTIRNTFYGTRSHCCAIFCIYLEPLLVNKGTTFTTALCCHRFGSRDIICHVTIRSAVGDFL